MLLGLEGRNKLKKYLCSIILVILCITSSVVASEIKFCTDTTEVKQIIFYHNEDYIYPDAFLFEASSDFGIMSVYYLDGYGEPSKEVYSTLCKQNDLLYCPIPKTTAENKDSVDWLGGGMRFMYNTDTFDGCHLALNQIKMPKITVDIIKRENGKIIISGEFKKILKWLGDLKSPDFDCKLEFIGNDFNNKFAFECIANVDDLSWDVEEKPLIIDLEFIHYTHAKLKAYKKVLIPSSLACPNESSLLPIYGCVCNDINLAVDQEADSCIEKECDEGFHYDDLKKQCAEDGVCSFGYRWIEVLKKCFPKNMEVDCGEGYLWNEDIKDCIEGKPSLKDICPVGYLLTAGGCVADENLAKYNGDDEGEFGSGSGGGCSLISTVNYSTLIYMLLGTIIVGFRRKH